MPKPDFNDIAGTAGIAMLTAGGWMVYTPLALIIPGLALTALAIAAAKRG